MPPINPLPLHEASLLLNADDYVESLLSFVTSNELFQRLCGGVHILDFFTREPSLYADILSEEWRIWFHYHDVSDVLDLLMRERLDDLISMRDLRCNDTQAQSAHENTWRDKPLPPLSLVEYILCIRKYALDRSFERSEPLQKTRPVKKPHRLPRHVSVGMKPKKIHEVEHFAQYIDDLSRDVDLLKPHRITHIVDFGSGQNYLGRALASPPYAKHVIALESRQHNIDGARIMDVTARLSVKCKVMRNKKQHRQGFIMEGPEIDVKKKISPPIDASSSEDQHSDKDRIFETRNGSIHYIEKYIDDGRLSIVITEIAALAKSSTCLSYPKPQLMVVSLHSCGNLLHHGLRSLIMNPAVGCVAMIGCCYNLLTERLGPPTYKLPSLRSSNLRVHQTSCAYDPHGFPMSERLAAYQHQHGSGVRLNITARMMAVQAPENWTDADCESFFTRHFYRAVLQRILLDRGIVQAPMGEGDRRGSPRGWTGPGPALTIGSLRKACYASFTAYVRGAIQKLVETHERGNDISTKMADLTDEEIGSYEERYSARRKELSIIWSLMAFSASVVEATIVVDRWLYLREQEEVKQCWVETVFDYTLSPRNLVVVGIKR